MLIIGAGSARTYAGLAPLLMTVAENATEVPDQQEAELAEGGQPRPAQGFEASLQCSLTTCRELIGWWTASMMSPRERTW
jgi:hypothetical protein